MNKARAVLLDPETFFFKLVIDVACCNYVTNKNKSKKQIKLTVRLSLWFGIFNLLFFLYCFHFKEKESVDFSILLNLNNSAGSRHGI